MPRLTADLILTALGSLGIAELNKAVRLDSTTAVRFPAPITRDGPGFRADIDLPPGVTAGDVIERRDRLASGLRRPLGAVGPEADHDTHAGRLILWVGDKPMAKTKAAPWLLLKHGTVDLFAPFPIGVDPRGRPVTVILIYALAVIGALPRMGKTALLRLLALLAAAKGERNGARWVVALALGLRQGEALGLQWSDLDEVKELLWVKRNRTRPRYEHGCAPACGRRYAGHCPQRRNTRPETDTTKSRAGKHPVPVPAAIMTLLEAHREVQAVERRTAAQLWSDQGYMFADELGRAINPRTDWDRWKRLLAAADVRDGRLHDARHTAATMLLLLGVHERATMSVLGWSTTAMANRYTHVTGAVQADLAARLDALLWSSSETGTETN